MQKSTLDNQSHCQKSETVSCFLVETKVLHSRKCENSQNSVWLSLNQCCHQSFCCNWGGKQGLSLFNKNVWFELVGLTWSFSLTWKKEGCAVKTSDIAMVHQQWNELSAVVWLLSFCSSHGKSVHIYYLIIFTTGSCSSEPGLWETSCSSPADPQEGLSTTMQINSSSAEALAPICKITLLCCLQLPGTPMHLPGAGGDESWWIFALAHIFTGKANCTLQEPLGSGWPVMWEVTVYKQIDFLLALWNVTVFPLFPLFLQ